MTKSEFVEKLTDEYLLTVSESGIEKRYIDGDLLLENGVWRNYTDVFGIYHDAGRFYTFMTDHERGLPAHFCRSFDDESSACEYLYRIAVLAKNSADSVN